MSYVFVNVHKPTNRAAGAGGNKLDLITLYRKDDVLTFPSRDSKGVRITDDIVMKPGRYASQIYAQVETINKGYTVEGDGDAQGFKHNLAFTHPGDELAVSEFTQNNLHEDFYAVVQKCDSSEKRLLGTPCAPLRMKNEHADGNEATSNAFTFQSITKTTKVPGFYEGTITLDTVKDTVAAGATTFSVANGEGEYQLTGDVSAAEITTLTDAVHGGVYTLLGIESGATAPTVADGNDFLLKDGATWTATGGARLTVRAAKSGASAWTFIEQSRS